MCAGCSLPAHTASVRMASSVKTGPSVCYDGAMIRKASHVTRVGKRNQVTIPAAMLRSLGVSPGEEVEVRLGDEGDIHVSRADDAWAEFAGCLERPGQPVYTDDELMALMKQARQEIADAAAQRYLRSLNDGG